MKLSDTFSTLDKDIEKQQIDFVLNQLLYNYSHLINRKKIALNSLQMVLGTVLQGQQMDQIDLGHLIRALRRRGYNIE